LVRTTNPTASSARDRLLDGVAQLVHERCRALGVRRVRGRIGILGECGHSTEGGEEGRCRRDGTIDAGAQRVRRHGLGLEVGG
jgi:hypothetical protein